MSGFPPSRREPRGSACFECGVIAQAAVAATRRPSSPRQVSPPPASPAAQPCPPPSSYRSFPLAPPHDCAELDVLPRCHPTSSQHGHTRLRRDRCCRQPRHSPRYSCRCRQCYATPAAVRLLDFMPATTAFAKKENKVRSPRRRHPKCSRTESHHTHRVPSGQRAATESATTRAECRPAECHL